MKLNKLLFVLLSVALSLGFTSCSDDDDDSANSLVGTWHIIADKTTLTTSNEKATELLNEFSSQYDDSSIGRIYIFREDLTFQMKENISDPRNDDVGTYQVEGNQIDMRFDNLNNDKMLLIIDSLDGNSLILSINSKGLNMSLEYYFETYESFYGSASIKMLKQKFEAASIDISTIKIKEIEQIHECLRK